ncbi:MAG: response regulator [Candidatus Dormibacteria bacterium]
MTRILVVDDSPEIRFLIQLILAREPRYVVTEAIHGQAALDAIALPPMPDIVVTDLMMPVMSGMELIRRLRQDPDAASIRIVVVSSNVDGSEGGEIRHLADAVLSKEKIYPNLLTAVRGLEPGVAEGMRA